jgi:hypothetical protein
MWDWIDLQQEWLKLEIIKHFVPEDGVGMWETSWGGGVGNIAIDFRDSLPHLAGTDRFQNRAFVNMALKLRLSSQQFFS